MDHDQAIHTQASMRYVLGELTPAECDSFEEHYADCSVCMSDVELATVFAANAREVFREKAWAKDRPKGSPWLQWRPFPALALSAALNLILMVGLGYGLLRSHGTMPMDSSIVSQLESVDIVPVHGTTRGSEGAGQVIRASARPVVLKFDVPQPYDHYYYSIDRAGSAVLAGEVKVSGQPESVNLSIPVIRLTPGEYQVTVTGALGAVRQNLVDCRLQVEPR
jgi:putative zinc finger protein